MNAVMSGYIDDFVLVYLDDILVYSDNEEEHEAHLRRVFDRLHEHKLQAKLKKCEFGKPYVKYVSGKSRALLLRPPMCCNVMLTRRIERDDRAEAPSASSGTAESVGTLGRSSVHEELWTVLF